MLVISKSERKNQEMKQNRDSIANENRKIYAELEEMRNELEIVRRDDEELKRTISRIDTEKNIIIDDRDKIAMENSRLSAELKDLRNQLIQRELEIEQLKEKLSSITLEKMKVIENRDSTLIENRQLSTELETLRTHVEMYQIEEKRDTCGKTGDWSTTPENIRTCTEKAKRWKKNQIRLKLRRTTLNAEMDELKRQFEIYRLEEGVRNKAVMQNRSQWIHCKCKCVLLSYLIYMRTIIVLVSGS